MATTLVIAAVVWLAWAAAAHALVRNPRGEPMAGLMLVFIRAYARWFHRMRVEGAEHLPGGMNPGPLIVVCNHTAGVDPLLVQAAVSFEITWMMARDMMPRALNALWEFAGVIPVNRGGSDLAAARAALRRLAAGGVVGIFPEGGIERPARVVLPFQPGVGLLVHKSGAPVLQVVIDGTAQTPTAWGSLFQRSTRVVSVRFLPVLDYRAGEQSRLSAAEIAVDLRERLVRATGWRETGERVRETQR